MILSLLGMGLTGLVFQEIIFVKSYQRLSLSLPVARVALKTVFYLREGDLSPNYDTFDELASESQQVLCGNNSYKYYFVDKINYKEGMEIIDESALININLVSKEVLGRLPGLDEDLADKIINSGLRPFSGINELLMVEDVTEDKFLLFKDLITVYGQGKININTVNRSVLLALGLEDSLIDIIFRFRQEHKIGDSGIEFGRGFSNAGQILEDLTNFSSLGLSQQQDILALLSVLDVKSNYLRFNVVPAFGGQEGLHYSITVSIPAKKVLSWKEY